jgi:hypothetical protein
MASAASIFRYNENVSPVQLVCYKGAPPSDTTKHPIEEGTVQDKQSDAIRGRPVAQRMLSDPRGRPFRAAGTYAYLGCRNAYFPNFPGNM